MNEQMLNSVNKCEQKCYINTVNFHISRVILPFTESYLFGLSMPSPEIKHDLFYLPLMLFDVLDSEEVR